MQIRLNPVTLITGAGSGFGAACAHDLARKSHGGLILADRDEAALAVVADELDTAGAAPERVSTLAFDVADADRWEQAIGFIHGQYGRLDWAIVNTSAARPTPVTEGDLVDWGHSKVAHLEGAILSLRAIMQLMGKNTQGGAIVVTSAAMAIRSEADARTTPGLLQLVRAAAQEGAHSNVRINAIAPGGAETPMWAETPWFQDVVRETGSETAAFDKISQMPTPLARYAQTGDVGRLIAVLLTEEAPVTGATLVVDGGYTL
ncbi:MAG: SDR family NAD(P)-dependent oxidoreductase [Caulobacteraceae bacterium]